MQLGPKIAEGKTKTIYAHPSDPLLAIMFFKDDITAGDGAKHDLLPGKGKYDWETATHCLQLLNKKGIETHFVESPEPGYMVVRKMKMIPLECVCRRIGTGSLLKRLPFKEGQKFDPILFELFLKDDALNDPFVNENQCIALNEATRAELEYIEESTRQVFEALEPEFAKQDITLVDLKIEFGRTPDGKILVGDDLTNNSWRIWPGGKKENMLDKQLYRDGKVGMDAVLEGFKKAADISRKFGA